MGKHSKNGTGSGGDERIMYNRRYKSTSNASKASTNENLTKKMNSESSSRSKNSGTTSQQNTNLPKSISKSKLRSPVKPGLGQSANRINKPDSDYIGNQKPAGTSTAEIQSPKMKQVTANTEQQIPVSMQAANKEATEQFENKMKESTHTEIIPTSAHHGKNGDSNGVHNNETSENNLNENKNGQADQNGDECLDINEKGEEFNLHLDAEENCLIIDQILESSSIEESLAQFNQITEETDELKPDAETYSVDVVESTTSEMVEATESNVPLQNKEKMNENEDLNPEMQKNVNVNVEEGVKTTQPEEENADQSSAEYLHRDTTFGKTLRTISGRHSIGRMRHITVRDRQPSPNSSLFVNTSGASLSESGLTPRILRSHRNTPTPDLSSSKNGTEKIDRKRKIAEKNVDVQKKVKTEEEKNSSFLNSSLELLKKPFRRSVTESTLNKSEKEQIQPTGGELVKYGEPVHKKWCSIM